jgi:hypothetical protein
MEFSLVLLPTLSSILLDFGLFSLELVLFRKPFASCEPTLHRVPRVQTPESQPYPQGVKSTYPEARSRWRPGFFNIGSSEAMMGHHTYQPYRLRDWCLPNVGG